MGLGGCDLPVVVPAPPQRPSKTCSSWRSNPVDTTTCAASHLRRQALNQQMLVSIRIWVSRNTQDAYDACEGAMPGPWLVHTSISDGPLPGCKPSCRSAAWAAVEASAWSAASCRASISCSAAPNPCTAVRCHCGRLPHAAPCNAELTDDRVRCLVAVLADCQMYDQQGVRWCRA